MRVPQRGRAILRRLSPHDSVHAFRPGDFLLTRSDAGLARILGWASGSELNHAAVIIDPIGTVVEANPALVSDMRAFRLSTVSDYQRAGKPCWIGYVELREGTRQEVVTYVERLVRSKGSVSGMGRVWLVAHAALSIAPRSWSGRAPWLRAPHSFFARHAIVLREEHCFSAGELVARALERGGFIWECDPANVTPADLFARYHLDEPPVHLKGSRISPIRRGARSARTAATTRVKAGTPASITPFAPRGTRGATALADAPHGDELPQTGMRALVQVGVLMAAGLAVIGVLEEMLRFVRSDA